jgi:hypothetical protein
MWAFLLFLLPIPFPWVTAIADDPAPGITTGKDVGRNLECVHLSEQEAHERYPGIVSEAPPRGSFIETRALECRARVFSYGERPGAEEALLWRLTAASGEIAKAADDPTLTDATWLVEAFHSDDAMAGKIAFAAKVALANRGRRVSDRVPALAAGDVLVIARMQPTQAYPVACGRYYAEGSLSDSDVLLAVIHPDRRETILHAGVCAKGRWRWIQ